jgi:mannosidase alpha-like ER degradation enhancer 2
LCANRYDSCLLAKAEDMGSRLLKAYDTPTGIPYGTVNLRSGVADDETTIR